MQPKKKNEMEKWWNVTEARPISRQLANYSFLSFSSDNSRVWISIDESFTIPSHLNA